MKKKISAKLEILLKFVEIAGFYIATLDENNGIKALIISDDKKFMQTLEKDTSEGSIQTEVKV